MSFYEGNSFADDSEEGPVSAFPFKAHAQSAFGAAASSAFAPKNGASAPARASHPQRGKDDDCEEASFHSSQYEEEVSDDEHKNSEDSYDEDEEDETQDSGSSQDASDYTDEEGEDEDDDEERSGAYPHDERSHSGSCVDDCGNAEELDENDRGSAASAEEGEDEDDEDDGYNDNTSEQFHSEEGENEDEDEEGEAAHESVSAANAPNATSAFGAFPTAHSAFQPASFAPAVPAPPTRAEDVAAPRLGTAWGTPTSSTAHAGISDIAAFSASGGGGTGTSGTSPATQPQGFVSLFSTPTGAGAARQPPAPPFAGVMEARTKASNDAPVATATTPTPLAPSSVATSTAAAPAAAFSSSCVHGTSAPAANVVESMVVDQGRAPRYESIPWKSATTASTRNAGKRFRSEAEEAAAVSALLARFEPAVPTERFDEQVRAVLKSL